MTWTVRQALQWTAGHLASKGSETGRLDAELLLARSLGVDRIQLYMDPDRPLSRKERKRYWETVQARALGAPVAHLLGEREFWSLSFRVTPAALIPRPDTEVVVERALAFLPREAPIRILELGTGTGCIAAALAQERPRAWVDAVELAPEAAALARANIAQLGLGKQITIWEGDWFAPVAGRTYDLVVANPPYLAETDPHLAEGEVAAEPRQALAAGPDGLDAYRAIVPAAPEHLNPGAWLVLEIGWDQGQAIQALLEEHGFAEAVISPDYGGRDRVVASRWHGTESAERSRRDRPARRWRGKRKRGG